MYCDFFRLSEKPFDVTPDPKFLYLSPQHQEALASLIYGIRERRGFIVMVGEVGTGKTTLLNAVLDRLDDQTRVAYIFNTKVSFDTLLNGALVDLGISDAHEFLSSWEAINRLNRFAIEALRAGRNVVLIVDEAQNLERGCMESLRLLSNLETRKHKLIQIVLSGQPELNIKLQDPQLRQLTQRISLRRYITEMSEEDTYAYIQHRLRIAQYNGTSLFDRKAQQRIWTYSGGIPRKINTLCDNALLIAYGLKKKRVRLEVVEEAIRDLNGMPAFEKTQGAPVYEDNPVPAKRWLRPGFALALGGSLLLFLVFNLWPHLVQGPLRPLAHWKPGHDKAANVSNVRTPIIEEQAPQGAAPAGFTPGHANRALESERRHEEEVEAEAPPVEEKIGSGIGKTTRPAEKVSEPPAVLPAPVKKQEEKPPETAVPEQTVVVQTGDTLCKILYRVYGRCNQATVRAVQEKNPGLSNPDQILVGQTIRLPNPPQSP